MINIRNIGISLIAYIMMVNPTWPIIILNKTTFLKTIGKSLRACFPDYESVTKDITKFIKLRKNTKSITLISELVATLVKD